MTEIVAATANLGNAGDAKVREDILGLLGNEGVEVLCMQEAGDRNAVLRSIVKDHPNTIDLYDGDGSPGATSTPIMWQTALWSATHTRTIQLSGRFHAPIGVGPNWVKPKVLNIVWLRNRITGETVIVCSTHLPASLWARLRAEDAKKIIDRVAQFGFFHDQWPLIIGADWNAQAGSRILTPLRSKGQMKSAQGKLGPVETHGKRTIDDLWTRKLRVTGLRAVETSSDHRALIATASLP